MSDDFDEWWDQNADLKFQFVPIGQAKQLWCAATIAAQRDERKRIIAILEDAGTYCSWDKIMEAIDQ